MTKKPPTKAEQAHMARVIELGCIVCMNKGYGFSPAEIHHPRNGQGLSQRANHKDGMPLCPQHHRLGGYGVAIGAGQKRWEELYGTERKLLEQVIGILEVK